MAVNLWVGSLSFFLNSLFRVTSISKETAGQFLTTSKPLCTISGNNIIHPIANKGGYDPEDAHPSIGPSKVWNNFKYCCGSNECLTLVNYYYSIHPFQFMPKNQWLSQLRFQVCKFKGIATLNTAQKPHPPVAEEAFSIKQNKCFRNWFRSVQR